MPNLLNKKLDKVGKIGCYVSIFSSISIMLISLLLIFLLIFKIDIMIDNFTVFLLILNGVFQPLPLILSIRLLQSKPESHIATGIIVLVCSWYIGGILILVGKYETDTVSLLKKQSEKNIINDI